MESYGAQPLGTPRVAVTTERDTPGGWWYTIEAAEGAESRTIRLTLSWADHDHWSGGAVRPSAVAEAALWVLLEHLGLRALPDSFDCARGRRLINDFDERVRARL